MTLVTPWASLGPGEPVLSWSAHGSGDCSPPGPHLDLVNLFPIWASPSPGDFDPLLDLFVVDHFWPHLQLVILILSTRLPYLVTLVLTWASTGPSDDAPHLLLIWTW